MTPDQHHSPSDDRPTSIPPGVARRTAIAAAWTTPVIAAAVAAPGASASPVGAGIFAGVSISSSLGEGRFFVLVLLNTTATTTTTDVVFGEDVRVDIAAEHDVASWGEGVVADGPRSGHLVIPAGSHPVTNSYETEGRLAAEFTRVCFCELTASPKGSFTVSATVTRGPLYQGSDPAVKAQYGSSSAVGTVTI
ncbi:hypothetical protein [Rathayibacter sp. VKM Ac-2927]|uniref:hypothetical protein n=1 Tax=Rathayibacter sp. VKM Ac-2927 TaxID=2929478 RepID=UPI001FB4316F|nr:hypothetical protein [Rathayibacter sp. VKM Ac-2927]MCJ1687217.1 hypothetical protein [Rathayibacter sp. VKM Ac-2927]